MRRATRRPQCRSAPRRGRASDARLPRLAAPAARDHDSRLGAASGVMMACRSPLRARGPAQPRDLVASPPLSSTPASPDIGSSAVDARSDPETSPGSGTTVSAHPAKLAARRSDHLRRVCELRPRQPAVPSGLALGQRQDHSIVLIDLEGRPVGALVDRPDVAVPVGRPQPVSKLKFDRQRADGRQLVPSLGGQVVQVPSCRTAAS